MRITHPLPGSHRNNMLDIGDERTQGIRTQPTEGPHAGLLRNTYLLCRTLMFVVGLSILAAPNRALSQSLPDMIVISISYDSSTGLFGAVIKNRGAAATPASTAIPVSFTVDGTWRTWASAWGPLAAGASVTVNSAAGSSGGGPYTIPTGTHTIIADANDSNKFSESNATNNSLAQTITIGETPSIASFSSTIGVNIHMHDNWGGDAYTNVSTVESELAYAGIRHARDVMNYAADVTTLQNIHTAAGTTYDVFVGSNLAQNYTYIAGNAGIVEAVEGFNEPENFPRSYGGLTGIPAAVAAQQQLWSDMQSASSTRTIPVNTMALADPLDASTVGNISAYTNQVSTHVYPAFYGTSGESTFSTMQGINSESMPMAPNHPVVITEAGWWTSPGAKGTTEAAQAKLTLSLLLDAYLQAVTRTYLYELVDEHQPITSTSTATMTSVGSVFGPITLPTGLPNLVPGTTISITHDSSDYLWGTIYSYNSSTGAASIAVTKLVGSGTYSSWSVLNNEDAFGLFHWDGTPKQSATALHNLAAIVADPSGLPGVLPGTETFALAGMPTTARSLVFERSDGAYFVALWRDDAIWDNNGNEIPVTPTTVTVTPSVTPGSISVYNPLSGTSPISSTTAASVSVSLGDTPQFVLIH